MCIRLLVDYKLIEKLYFKATIILDLNIRHKIFILKITLTKCDKSKFSVKIQRQSTKTNTNISRVIKIFRDICLPKL